MAQKIKVLIVDDSALIRQMLTSILSNDPAIEVVGAAPDALKAREMIKRLNPDVVTLDIEMPKMNGIDFLRKIMTLRPMPVVMISTLTQNGANITLQALEIGAVDFVAKPQQDVQRNLEDKAKEITDKVKAAAGARIRPLEEIDSDHAAQNKVAPLVNSGGDKNIVVFGASTGGVEAIRTVLSRLPSNMPPIFIVQHMPKQFTTTFAKRLDKLCAMDVHEAEDYMVAKAGHVYLAPGDKHLRVARSKGELVCRLVDGNPVSGHIPSVDVLFDSVCHVSPTETIGVMLSGMGRDGAESMLKLKQAGAYNVGQDEASCVVYGMPKAAFERGAVHKQVDIKKIADELISLCDSNGEASE
ncbi:fused chemotaxis regulator; protein-glutamate methylesterase in two-component regulatory system with CheA [Candidatus Terasakiella magnetica]|uniref:Protein-glutamate methylesterase/protein-glutamine glutaminase n=1 Tax=Candidatus Terasakiella magnetica TaxID=1867952 RepID=A0A1C3RC50_9PROT|nr:chemotaxis response regulator protein-glutamate methylesterase [Candidatus Terasakiella magnetica]SCA54857.1 fused chemotaxis regulator; protein-glutamate methylesterase in two-component regulatory system with CheA [Candidatus Terasakiella magnetica]